MTIIQRTFSWKGASLGADVLYSRSGCGTQILIGSKTTDILFDCGDGTLRDLLDSEYNFARLRNIFFTHEHYDHFGGLYQLLFYMTLNEYLNDLMTVHYPDGSREIPRFLEMFMGTYGNKNNINLNGIPLLPQKKIFVKPLSVLPFPVFHELSPGTDKSRPDFKRAFGYSISENSETIVYTGDTGMFPELAGHVTGAELLIIEGSLAENDKYAYHLTVSQAESLGKCAKEYFIIHRE